MLVTSFSRNYQKIDDKEYGQSERRERLNAKRGELEDLIALQEKVDLEEERVTQEQIDLLKKRYRSLNSMCVCVPSRKLIIN